MSAESEIITAFLSRCHCPIAMNNADVEELILVKMRHGTREEGIEAPLSLKAPKGAIDAGVVDLWHPILASFDGQLFPLTTEVQQFQNIVENLVQRELRLGTATPLGQKGQDKFLKLF